MSVKEIEAEIRRLSPEDQAYLLERLGLLIDPDEEEPLTKEELDRRFNEMVADPSKCVTVEEMMASAKKLL